MSLTRSTKLESTSSPSQVLRRSCKHTWKAGTKSFKQ
ncbi:hypothetical protein CIPAW_10G121800 [Carya illinoinensis]|uniref:Uncharacterized protein n=1 Tax=Carya illinoinensis TaxID=32201 RepID=A0A8T1P584_CARIL|nr:hypothetical protein CIPAW_10G121800 [Carya illinoinensis]